MADRAIPPTRATERACVAALSPTSGEQDGQGADALSYCPIHPRVIPRVVRGRAGSRVVTEGGCQVDRPGAAEHTDDQVAQAGHGLWAGAGADLGSVLGEGDIAGVVQRLDRPVAAEQVGQPGGADLGVGETGDRVGGHRLPPSGWRGACLAGDLQDLGGVGEPEVTDGDGLEGAVLDAAVAAVAGGIQNWDAVPGQALAAGQQGRLVGLDRNR